MKRLLCLLLALCLPAYALAETVAEHIGAPERWQGECQSNTGKTRVFVDMTVHVPEVEAIPIWAVKERTFSVEEVTNAADVLLGEGNWRMVKEDWPFEPLEGEPRYTLGQNGADNVTYYYLYLDSGQESVGSDYMVYNSFPDWYLFNSFGYAVGGSHSGGNIGTLEGAISLADSVVGQIASELVYESCEPQVDGYIPNRKDGDYGYRLYYTRQIAGVPVTLANRGVSVAENPQYAPPLQREQLAVDVGEGGIFELNWQHPIEITGMIAEDCELLSFDQIMDIFTTICPLKYQMHESGGSTTLNINRAALGYMCLQERNNPTSYRLIPVWDFFGTRDYHGFHDDYHNRSYFTINAIDGTVIDRSLGY